METSMARNESIRYVRYAHEGREQYGIQEGDSIRELEGDLFADPVEAGTTVAVSDARILAPCRPTKVIAIGLNYHSHLRGRPVPEKIGVFSMFPTSIIGLDDEIVIPPDTDSVHYEGELVVVIGKKAKGITPAEAPGHIFGVTAGNDVSERGWQRDDLQWFRAKGSDTFAPLGPAIVTGLDYNDLMIETRLNGEVRQHESSADLIFGIHEIVSYVSRYVTLLPGDIIFTGTPGTTAEMRAGDTVEVEIAGIGTLRNKVVGGSNT
jgi:2-keto-4-pentenoate hydratase/2-oxohepta-3-ene-1,7-dioic acid hydratase in catechol pathway